MGGHRIADLRRIAPGRTPPAWLRLADRLSANPTFVPTQWISRAQVFALPTFLTAGNSCQTRSERALSANLAQLIEVLWFGCRPPVDLSGIVQASKKVAQFCQSLCLIRQCHRLISTHKLSSILRRMFRKNLMEMGLRNSPRSVRFNENGRHISCTGEFRFFSNCEGFGGPLLLRNCKKGGESWLDEMPCFASTNR